jgi:primosomal replication protein N
MTTPPFVNRVHLQGQVSSHPVQKAMNARTSFTTFELTLVESWDNADGQRCERKNRVTVEVVGRDSDKVFARAGVGSWVTIEGYIRSEIFKGEILMKVRTLSVYLWEVPVGTRPS